MGHPNVACFTIQTEGLLWHHFDAPCTSARDATYFASICAALSCRLRSSCTSLSSLGSPREDSSLPISPVICSLDTEPLPAPPFATGSDCRGTNDKDLERRACRGPALDVRVASMGIDRTRSKSRRFHTFAFARRDSLHDLGGIST